MSEDIEIIKAEELEKRRLNQLKFLKYTGYEGESPDKMTIEQIDARIELQLIQNKKDQADPTTPTPSLFKGIDGERANSEAVTTTIPTYDNTMKYNALVAFVPQIRKDVVKYTNNARICRIPASIRLNDTTQMIERVVL